MSEQMMHPVRKRAAFSPALLELVIVILFFALSTSVVVQLFAKASDVSKESAYHSRALLALETTAEETKADPEGDGSFDENGVRAVSKAFADDLTVTGTVTREPTDAGMIYEIDLSVNSADGTVYTLGAARYVAGAEVLP